MFHKGNRISKTFTTPRADIDCHVHNTILFVYFLHVVDESSDCRKSQMTLWAWLYLTAVVSNTMVGGAAALPHLLWLIKFVVELFLYR